ncbi:MAG: hypothetical protein WBM86_16205 [Waterburya sp.]
MNSKRDEQRENEPAWQIYCYPESQFIDRRTITLSHYRFQGFILMFQPEDDSNQDPWQKSESNKNLENIDSHISPESLAVRKKQLESIFIKLIAMGLALGAVLGGGAYYLLHKLGLTKKPYQLEQEKIEPEKQPQTPVPEIKTFPRIPEPFEG